MGKLQGIGHPSRVCNSPAHLYPTAEAAKEGSSLSELEEDICMRRPWDESYDFPPSEA